MLNSIADYQLDQLKEIMNIGASHASTALSQMIKKKVSLTVPNAYVDEVQNINTYIKNKDQEVTAALLKIFGDANGSMFFMFNDESDFELSKLLISDFKNVKNVRELEISAVKEVGNILAGASLSAFAKFLDMNLLHSVSDVVVDTTDSIINSIVSEIGKTSGVALTFEVGFTIVGTDIKTRFFFFIDPNATASILKALDKKYKS